MSVLAKGISWILRLPRETGWKARMSASLVFVLFGLWILSETRLDKSELTKTALDEQYRLTGLAHDLRAQGKEDEAAKADAKADRIIDSWLMQRFGSEGKALTGTPKPQQAWSQVLPNIQSDLAEAEKAQLERPLELAIRRTIHKWTWWILVVGIPVCLLWWLLLPDHGLYHEWRKKRKATQSQEPAPKHISEMTVEEIEQEISDTELEIEALDYAAEQGETVDFNYRKQLDEKLAFLNKMRERAEIAEEEAADKEIVLPEKAEEERYSGWNHVAKMHLLEYQPKLAATVNKEGRFKEYLQRLGLNASDMYENLVQRGASHQQATEIVEHDLILRPDIGEEESPDQEELDWYNRTGGRGP